jgi:hypothetical protein
VPRRHVHAPGPVLRMVSCFQLHDARKSRLEADVVHVRLEHESGCGEHYVGLWRVCVILEQMREIARKANMV